MVDSAAGTCIKELYSLIVSKWVPDILHLRAFFIIMNWIDILEKEPEQGQEIQTLNILFTESGIVELIGKGIYLQKREVAGLVKGKFLRADGETAHFYKWKAF